MDTYDRLERDSATPKKVVDHSRLWEKLEPVASANGGADLLARFCESKRISVESLTALGARMRVVKSGAVELAFAGVNQAGAVTAIKYRPLSGSSHDSYAQKPSTWLQPIIVGNRDSLDWLVAEGETDAARLYGLVGDRAAVLVMPAGAKTFKREWVKVIPRGASVGLCHDADEDGDAGAEKAAKLLGSGTTYRLRPPNGGDWCDWDGNRDAFLELVKAATSEAHVKFHWTPLAAVAERPISFVLKPFLQASAFHLLAGIKNAGKGTWLAYWAAQMTLGNLGERRRVVWIANGEDSYSIDVRPRIRAAGGDLNYVTVLERGHLVLPDDVGELERLAAELGDVGMFIIDPVGGSLGSGKNTNFDADVRPALTALNDLADTTGAIALGVRHISLKTDSRAGGTLAGILGSVDWVNIPRAVLVIVHDDTDSGVRHLFVKTGNRVRDDTPGLMFRIEGADVVEGGEEVTVARVLGESAKDPDELLAFKKPRDASKTGAARTLILELLAAADDQRMESDTLDAEIAKRTGLAAQTIRNTRTKMGRAGEGLVRSVPEKDEFGEVKRWFVTLTGAGVTAAYAPETQNPPSHYMTVSGLNKPDTVSRESVAGVSGFLDGESRDLGDEASPADFVKPPENGRTRLTPEQQAAIDALPVDENGHLL